MKEFEIEKQKLLELLDYDINKHQSDNYLKKIKTTVKSLKNHSDLNGLLTRMVIDGIDFSYKSGEKLIEFEEYYRDKTNLIKSNSLKQLAKMLVRKGYKILFYGQAWSNQNSDWIYFDTVLDTNRLREKFNFGENIIVHENLDPKSGTEKGFIDNITGEGLMGRITK